MPEPNGTPQPPKPSRSPWPKGLTTKQRRWLQEYGACGRPYMAATNAKCPYATVADWIAKAKSQPDSPIGRGYRRALEMAVVGAEDRLGHFRDKDDAVGLQATLRTLEARDPSVWSPRHQVHHEVEVTVKRLVLDQPRTVELTSEGSAPSRPDSERDALVESGAKFLVSGGGSTKEIVGGTPSEASESRVEPGGGGKLQSVETNSDATSRRMQSLPKDGRGKMKSRLARLADEKAERRRKRLEK